MQSEEFMINVLAEFVKSAVWKKIKEDTGVTDEYIKNNMGMLLSSLHFHGGQNPEIAWNDVDEIEMMNRFMRRPANKSDIELPSFPTEGYNQHHHTSEFDGGVLPGIAGVHNHCDLRNGGFSFSVFHPATSVPQADWED